MNVKAVWERAKPPLFWAMVAVIMAIYGYFAWLALIAWGFSTWYSGRELANRTMAWEFLLSVANFFMILAVAIAARNPMKILNFAGGFWAAGLAFALLGVSHLTIIAIVAVVIVSESMGDTMLPALTFSGLTNIFLASGAVFAAIVTPLWGGNRRAAYALGFLYGAVAAHTAVVVLFLGAILERMSEAYGYGEGSIVLIWLGLSAGVGVLGVLSWRQGRAVFTLAGAATAAVAFVGAWFYAPPFYGGGLPYASWHPVWVCAVPLLLFLAVLRRGRMQGFGRAG